MTERDALRDAHAFFRRPRTLDPSWVPDYLNRRNLYPQMRYAGIGYAPGGWTVLTDHLRSLAHDDQVIEAAGLARRASTGNLIDHFRDRLMVPVADADHQLVGFIGRASIGAGPDVPKYLNSPASDLFDKSNLLYALGEDRAELTHGAMPVIVEGPLDRLALRQGVKNLSVVGLAPLGTALTEAQIRQLVDVVGTRRPIAVALDADDAGRQAAVRAWDRLTGAGLRNLLYVALPDGRDPADLVRAGHGRHLRHAIVEARPLAIAVADHKIAAAGNLDHFQRRLAVLDHLLDQDLTKVLPERLGPYLGHLAQRLQLDHQEVTAAAIDRLAPTNLSDPSARSPGDVVEAFTAKTLTDEAFQGDHTDRTSLAGAISIRGSELEDQHQVER